MTIPHQFGLTIHSSMDCLQACGRESSITVPGETIDG